MFWMQGPSAVKVLACGTRSVPTLHRSMLMLTMHITAERNSHSLILSFGGLGEMSYFATLSIRGTPIFLPLSS